MTYAQKQRVIELVQQGFGVPRMICREAVFPDGARIDYLGIKHDSTYKP